MQKQKIEHEKKLEQARLKAEEAVKKQQEVLKHFEIRCYKRMDLGV